MPRLSATVGIRPTMTNSVVPMAKALRVSANKASDIEETPVQSGRQSLNLIAAEKEVDVHNSLELESRMKTTIEELLAFVAVIDAGSLTAAADRLEQTVSGVSRTMSRLEEKLGTTLLRRTTRRLELT